VSFPQKIQQKISNAVLAVIIASKTRGRPRFRECKQMAGVFIGTAGEVSAQPSTAIQIEVSLYATRNVGYVTY
jgi:hypothetical protein